MKASTQQIRASLIKIAADPSTTTDERLQANRLIARLDGRLEEHDRIRAAMGLASSESPIVRTATSVSFHPLTAEQAKRLLAQRGR